MLNVCSNNSDLPWYFFYMLISGNSLKAACTFRKNSTCRNPSFVLYCRGYETTSNNIKTFFFYEYKNMSFSCFISIECISALHYYITTKSFWDIKTLFFPVTKNLIHSGFNQILLYKTAKYNNRQAQLFKIVIQRSTSI